LEGRRKNAAVAVQPIMAGVPAQPPPPVSFTRDLSSANVRQKDQQRTVEWCWPKPLPNKKPGILQQSAKQ
jgi:hypothetical protein